MSELSIIDGDASARQAREEVTEPFVVVRNVCKTFPGTRRNPQPHRVLEGLSFSVPRHQILGIIAPNGMGKTVTCNLLSNELQPDSGTISIGGKPPGKVRVGYVYQNYRDSLFPWLQTIDNISLGLIFAGVPRGERWRRTQDLLAHAKVEIDLRAFPYQHSGGRQQLIAFFRAMMMPPELLLMDEPFHSLDLENKLLAEEAILRICEQTPTTAILVSHDPADLVFLADRVAVLTPRPPHLVGIVEIDLPRPRNYDSILSNPRSILLEREIKALFKEAQLSC